MTRDPPTTLIFRGWLRYLGKPPFWELQSTTSAAPTLPLPYHRSTTLSPSKTAMTRSNVIASCTSRLRIRHLHALLSHFYSLHHIHPYLETTPHRPREPEHHHASSELASRALQPSSPPTSPRLPHRSRSCPSRPSASSRQSAPCIGLYSDRAIFPNSLISPATRPETHHDHERLSKSCRLASESLCCSASSTLGLPELPRGTVEIASYLGNAYCLCYTIARALLCAITFVRFVHVEHQTVPVLPCALVRRCDG